ncbi:hypothetical protein ACF0H5_021655 [Mactra antiquata]
MKLSAFIICSCMYIVLFQSTSGSRIRKINEKIKSLKAQMDLENILRRNDYGQIISRLDDLTSKLKQIEVALNLSDTTYEIPTYTSNESYINTDNNNQSSEDHKLSVMMKDLQEQTRVNKLTKLHVQQIETDLRKTNKRIRQEIDKVDARMNRMHFGLRSSLKGIRNDILSRNTFIQDTVNESSRMILTNVSNMIETIDKSICNKLTLEINNNCETKPNTLTDSRTNKDDNTESSLKSISSCKEWYDVGYKTSGVYTINIAHNITDINVYCDHDSNGGGWTVFQRRQNGNVDFSKDWETYKAGFGDINDEFWFGNEYLHHILRDGNHELRIELEDFYGNKSYAKYDHFSISSERSMYTLAIHGYQGTAGNSLMFHNDQPFVTIDRDNTSNESWKSCSGGWWNSAVNIWFASRPRCRVSSYLNGRYYNFETNDTDGIIWRSWKRSLNLKFVEMKFR